MTDFELFKENATFIVGHPRAGTTLLRTLFDHHPQLVTFPVESHFFDWVKYKDKVKGFFESTSFERHCKKYFDADISDTKDRLRQKFKTANSQKGILLSLIETYFEIEDSEKKDKRRWIEKTPSHINSIPTFKKWFGENLKVIYMYRDPRDVFVSVRKKYLSTKLMDVCSSYGLCYGLHSLYRKYHKWFFSVKFEELLSNPEETIKGLCQFLNIEFNEVSVRPTINGKPFPGNSRFGEELFSLSKKPIGRHVDYLSEKEIGHIELFLDKPMRDYGYINNLNLASRGLSLPKIANYKDYYTFLLFQKMRLLKHKTKWWLTNIFSLE